MATVSVNIKLNADPKERGSESTKKDLIHLFPQILDKAKVVYSGFSKKYGQTEKKVAANYIMNMGFGISRPFVLHVGNNAWYKNRLGVLQIYKTFIDRYENQNLNLVLVGPELDVSQQIFIAHNRISSKVHCLSDVDHPTLEALYNSAEAFLFPSRYEGFGWPPLEAQCCGCPVVSSNGGSLHEIMGDSALTAKWDDLTAHVENLHALLGHPPLKEQLINKGLENVQRFNSKSMIQSLCNVYRELDVA